MADELGKQGPFVPEAYDKELVDKVVGNRVFFFVTFLMMLFTQAEKFKKMDIWLMRKFDPQSKRFGFLINLVADAVDQMSIKSCYELHKIITRNRGLPEQPI